MTVKGMEVYYTSGKGNIVIAYNPNQAGGAVYNVYCKVSYKFNTDWEYKYTDTSLSKAINYAKRMYDVMIER